MPGTAEAEGPSPCVGSSEGDERSLRDAPGRPLPTGVGAPRHLH